MTPTTTVTRATLIVLAALVALGTTGCTVSDAKSALESLSPDAAVSKAVAEQVANEPPARETRTYELVIDTSGSTIPDRPMYLSVIKEVLEHMGYGDRLIVTEVSADSVANASVLLEVEVPAFEPNLTAEPASGNEFDVAEWKRQRTEDYEKQRAEFEASTDLTKIRAEVLKESEAKLLKRKTGASDILGAAEVAGHMAEGRSTNTLVIFLSDGLVSDGRINFARDKLDERRVTETLDRLEKEGTTADFAGARCYWMGVRGTRVNSAAAVRDFWLEYAKRADLSLEKGCLVGRPSLILLGDWLDRLDTAPAARPVAASTQKG